MDFEFEDETPPPEKVEQVKDSATKLSQSAPSKSSKFEESMKRANANLERRAREKKGSGRLSSLDPTIVSWGIRITVALCIMIPTMSFVRKASQPVYDPRAGRMRPALMMAGKDPMRECLKTVKESMNMTGESAQSFCAEQINGGL